MTNNTLLDGGNYSFDADHPYEIQFSGANDIHLPFPGTVIVPANTTTPTFGGMYRLMFLSLQYPTKMENGVRTFPVLRDFENKPLTVNGPCLILVADDSTFLDNVHLGNLADDFSNTYDPIYKDNTVLSSTARYLLIQFSPTSGISLPGNLNPLSRGKGFQLKNNTENGNDDVEILRNALYGGDLSGKILAFDLAGHQTEAYSSLLALGINAPIAMPPPADQIRIQFVDVHGSPQAIGDFPLQKLNLSPLLNAANFDNHKYYSFIPDDATGKKAEFSLQISNAGTPPPDAEKYRHRFHYTAVWPGYGSSFKQIGHAQATTLDFFKDIPEGSPKPRFVRLVLFHPADEFQTTAGGELAVKEIEDFVTGEIEEQAVFQNNGFRLFTHRNNLKVFNTGEGYFGDYYDEVNKLKQGDSLYQANWSGNAHLHLKGSMKTRLIQPSDAEPADVQKSLKFIREHALLVPLDPQPPDAEGHVKQDYLLVADHEQHGAQVKNSFAVDVETQPATGDPAPSRVHRSFVRPNAIFAWKLKGDPDSFDADNHSIPEEHTAYAYWKNGMGLVQETAVSHLISQSPAIPVHKPARSFPADLITLDINNQDPPQAIIRRTQTATNVRNALGLTGSPVNPLLLVLNLSAGSSHTMPLIPAGSDDNSSDLVLGTLAENATNAIPGMTGDDVLAVAVIEERLPAERDLVFTLLTSFKTFVYSNEAHQNAAVPRLPTESGGLLRQAIAKGVTVRGLMWEHLLKRLAGGSDIAKGHGDNHQLVNLINRTINGKRGYAFIDQATRELGAWHQKPVVMMRQVTENLGDDASFEGVAYLGGMDMALGRWETEYYFTRDPDRQSTGQNDVQMKITGDAAWDVLQNFRHRWKGIDLFLQDSDIFCNPVNTSVELEDEVSQPFFIPNPTEDRIKYPKGGNAFIQVNRTMPPYTCFSQQPIDGIIVDPQNGELGSLASYKKGLERARKFIFISEQYFFSPEIAIAVREALLRPGGPEFAIIVLPLELDESHYVDPLFFKLRQRTLNILRYGYATNSQAENSCEKWLPMDPGDMEDLSSRIAILSLVNYQGKDIYTHSKHIIVDDVWMTAGSANMSNRGLTYEMEINAAVVGQKLYEGGTAVVREQRIELCRRLLGLPKAYTAVLEDPYAAFRLFKAIETQQNSYSLNVYPLKPLVKWLDTSYVKRVTGDAQFNAGVDAVMNMDMNDPSFNYFICNLLDADGRRHDPDRLGYLAHLIGMGKVLSYALANLGITFGPTAYDPIRGLLLTGHPVTLTINTTIYTKQRDENGEPVLDDQGNPVRIPHGPYLQHQYPLAYNISDELIYLNGLASNQLSVTLSTEHLVVVTAVLTDTTTNQTLTFGGELTFDPDTTSIEYGQQYDNTLQII